MPIAIAVVKAVFKKKKIPIKFIQHSEEESSFVARKSKKHIKKLKFEMALENG